MIALCALASSKDIDLDVAVEAKFFDKDGAREWASAANPVLDP